MDPRQWTEPRTTDITVRHNVEMAHRLFQSPGKCEAIHGHSWWAELTIRGQVDETGKVLEFGYVKRAFRDYLDTNFDHHLLLNEIDPWSNVVAAMPDSPSDYQNLPGLQRFAGDPTTENVARILYYWGVSFTRQFVGEFKVKVVVWETSVNQAAYGDF